jgi:MYXO-CTERM domain-containing protein
LRRIESVVLVLLSLSVPVTAYAVTALMSVGGYNWDFTDSTDFWGASGVMIDGTSDAYDGCYYMAVDGVNYDPPGMPMLTAGGRQLEYGVQRLGSLDVRRIAYVPSADHNYARYLEILDNPGASAVSATLTITGNLGSDGGTMLTQTSSGDLSLTTMDSWFSTDDFDGGGDPSLAHVIQGSSPATRVSSVTLDFDNIEYSWNLSVPARGRVVIMHFAIQERNGMASRTEAERLVEAPEDTLVNIDEFLPDIVNFPTFYSCTEPEGMTCTTPMGATGICRGGVCCTGCWNGTRCQVGTRPSACGLGGGPCTDCADGMFCTLDSCTAGRCSSAPSPTICTDGMGCTMDTCHEATDSCTFMFVGGCIIGGMCVGEGETNPTYPCQVCDPARDSTDWSTMAEGMACGGGTVCAGGRLRDGACAADGRCVFSTTERCPTGACADESTCAPPCDASSCEDGEWCNPTLMRCERIEPLGRPCTAPLGCESGMCVDGVCCDALCEGTCSSCNLRGSEGACTAIPEGEDPDDECAMECDGERMCVGGAADAGAGDAGTPDAAVADAGADAGPGASDAGGIDAGTPPPPPDEGCGCAANGPSGFGSLALVLGALAVLLRRRRR